MENSSLIHLSQVVYNFCGLNYTTNLSSLEMKMNKRLKELNIPSLWSYNQYLEENEEEWDPLIELLTINETYFYREDKQLELYQNELLPTLAAQNKEIKVWSAGCSTGEEPYSLAILTKDGYPEIGSHVTIDATDINKRVLEVARKGSYSKKSLSFRRIPSEWLSRYFYDGTTDYTIHKDVQSIVTFSYLNLLDQSMYIPAEKYDVIFCRNVLIYFDDETIKNVAQRFYHALKPGGYLFLGHAETITKYNIGFETINSNGTFYYRKG